MVKEIETICIKYGSDCVRRDRRRTKKETKGAAQIKHEKYDGVNSGINPHEDGIEPRRSC